MLAIVAGGRVLACIIRPVIHDHRVGRGIMVSSPEGRGKLRCLNANEDKCTYGQVRGGALQSDDGTFRVIVTGESVR